MNTVFLLNKTSIKYKLRNKVSVYIKYKLYYSSEHKLGTENINRGTKKSTTATQSQHSWGSYIQQVVYNFFNSFKYIYISLFLLFWSYVKLSNLSCPYQPLYSSLETLISHILTALFHATMLTHPMLFLWIFVLLLRWINVSLVLGIDTSIA